MIKVTDIKPSKSNPEWEVVVVSNKSDKYVKAITESWGFIYEPKSANIPVLKEFNKFRIGLEYYEKEIITVVSTKPFWKGQWPMRNGKYYNNIIVDVTSESKLVVEFINGINDILKKYNILSLAFDNVIRINGLAPKTESLVKVLDFLQLNYKVLNPLLSTPDSDEEVVRKTYVENMCLVIGHKVEPVLMHLLTYLGIKIFKNNDFKVFISYTTLDFEDYGNLCKGNSDSCYFNLDYYSNYDYHNISSPIKASDFLKLDFSNLTSDYLENTFPNIHPSSAGYIEFIPEDTYDDYSISRANYEADRDAFDALTDGQFGDYDDYS